MSLEYRGGGGSRKKDPSAPCIVRFPDVSLSLSHSLFLHPAALAINTANLVPLLSIPGGSFAVFAPTDEALANLPLDVASRLFAPAWAPQLRNLLLYHVVGGSTLLDDGEHATMNYGGDVLSYESAPGPPKVNGQGILSDPVVRGNGAAYPIGALLAPPSLTSNVAQVLAADGRCGTLLAAAEAAGLGGVLAGEGPITVFGALLLCVCFSSSGHLSPFSGPRTQELTQSPSTLFPK